MMNLRNELCETEEISPEEFENEKENRQQVQPNAIVSVIAYLCGVPKEHFGKEYDINQYERLEKEECAKIIRCLTAVRNALMQKPGIIFDKMQCAMKNLDTMPEIIDPGYFEYLAGHGIRIVTGSKLKSVTDYIININTVISDRVGNAKKVVPSLVPYDYFRSMIVMPNGTKPKSVQSQLDRMHNNFNGYPFQCWINWPAEGKYYHEDADMILNPAADGNVLQNDRKFLTLVYRVNGEVFTDFERVSAVDEESCGTLSRFMSMANGAVMLVDCENADPYKLCATLDHMRSSGLLLNGALKKIVLFDDYHTVDTWDILKDYVSVPVEHEEVERVLGHKSLVDIALTAGACREHYCAGTNAFIVVSGDSDFWGMMRSMPDASFLVLAQKETLSEDARLLYSERGVSVAFTDDFSQNLSGIREGAIRHALEKRMNNCFEINFRDMFESAFENVRLKDSEKVRESMFVTVVKTLRTEIDNDGNLAFRIG